MNTTFIYNGLTFEGIRNFSNGEKKGNGKAPDILRRLKDTGSSQKLGIINHKDFYNEAKKQKCIYDIYKINGICVVPCATRFFEV